MILETGRNWFREASPVHRVVTLVSFLVSLCLLIALSFYTVTYFTGPLIDEWRCSQGEIPIVSADGTSESCLGEEENMPAGFAKHPLGNRPFNCNNRYGWEPLIHVASGGQDCIKTAGSLPPPPPGYRYRDYIIMS